MKLTIGCGRIIRKGYVNLDKIKLKGVNVVHDLNKFPYPFKDNTFDEILGENILEHLDDVMKVMEELHRISKSNAIIKLTVPTPTSADYFTDPTHKHAFTTRSFMYFEEKNPLNFYTKARFKVKCKIVFYRFYKILEFFVNLSEKFKHIYEIYFPFLFPANILKFELKVIK